MKEILFFSDPHYSVNSEKSEEKWFPPICDFLEKMGWHTAVKRFLKFWDSVTQSAFRRMIMEATPQGYHYDCVVGLGDYTPGANERGMLTKKAQSQYGTFVSVLRWVWSAGELLIWGDHDVGYHFNVGEKAGVKIGTEKGGVSVESVQIATDLIGPPFGCFSVGEANFVFIATNLIRNVDENSDVKLQKLKLEQENFLAKALNDYAGNIFLLLHDPTSLAKETAVRKIIDSNREKITAIMHGHLHAEFSRFFAKFSPVYGGLCKEYKTILVPASWGMMGIGGGFLVMNIYDDGTHKIKKYST